MNPDDIKRGHWYRFRDSNTIYLMLFEWSADGDHPRELEYICLHHNGLGDETRRQSAEQLARWCSAEVRPTWVDVEPDPRQIDPGEVIAGSSLDAFLDGL